MAITWGSLRQRVRAALLKDETPNEETGDFRWTDETLLYSCEMALTQLAQHTAVATATSFAPATQNSYILPDNLYDGEPLDMTGSVYVVDGETITYLDPVRYTPPLEPQSASGFYIHPEGVLNIKWDSRMTGVSFSEDSLLYIRYFAYYTPPAAADDIIGVPRWMETALTYLIAVHALSGAGVKTASIRQWGAKPDTGNPVDNPYRSQQAWFIKMYDAEMRRYNPQDRVNSFRVVDDNG